MVYNQAKANETRKNKPELIVVASTAMAAIFSIFGM